MTARPEIIVSPAEFPRDREVVATLFSAYAASLPVDLSFQDFAAELAGLPGCYAAERRGAVWLAYRAMEPTTSHAATNVAVGCIAIREQDAASAACELKRLYVTEDARGLGLGKLLTQAAMDKARDLGYRTMLLDTLRQLDAARKLYRSLGFAETDKYYENPLPGVVYMRAGL